jgi:hypothetical protein
VKNRLMIVKNVALQRQRRNAVHLIGIRDGDYFHLGLVALVNCRNL